MAPRPLAYDRLADAARAALGGGRRLAGVERVTGGTTKGVYRLTMNDDSTAVAYVWDATENYWPPRPGESDPSDPFSDDVGLDLFEAAHARLTALGVRVPAVRLLDRDRTYYRADLAVVEDVPGENLEELLTRDPHRAAPVMARLAEALERMRAHVAPACGKVAVVDAGGPACGASCEEAVLGRALRDLAEAASREPRIARARDILEERLRVLAARIRPRARYSVVHGELGPDHVLVDADGQPVLIDIEGLVYFDVEWEHVFLRIRFDDAYRPLAAPGLDEDRLALYLPAQRLSLTAGPLRLLDGELPHHRSFMADIAEHNLREALLLLGG
jgi:hypothetical protein